MSATLYIVPCSQRKSPLLLATRMPACDAYVGTGFKIARRLLEEAHAQWCILSGGYGFIWPAQQIEYYDQKITSTEPDERTFYHLTWEQHASLLGAPRVVVLGSRLYATAAERLLKRPVEAPVAGLPIGKMLQRLAAGQWLAEGPK